MERKLHGWLTLDRKFFSFLDEAEEHEKTLKQYKVKVSYSDAEDDSRTKIETVWAQNMEKAEARALMDYDELGYVVECEEIKNETS